ncbi:hypothetical protein F4803DRAFT_27392 [Xylaria telfairii]|nr:hypothetical protein F4803DRAFT_27392 [Xylaria telfairii]
MDSTPSTSFSSNDSHWRRDSTKHGRDSYERDSGKKRDCDSFALPSPSQTLDINPRTDTDSQGEGEDEDEDKSLHERAIDQAYKAIWNNFCGLPPLNHVSVFHIGCQRAYEKLHHKLADREGLLDHYKESVRRGWDEDTGDLILRLGMTTLHEVVAAEVIRAIIKEVDRIEQENPSLAGYCRNMISANSSSVSKKRKGSAVPYYDKCPDGQLRYKGTRYPPLILEVAYSQDERNVRQKAEDVLKRLPGQVCTVLALDIGYADPETRKPKTHSHQASVSTWVSIAKRNGSLDIKRAKAKVFRDESGKPVPGEILLPFDIVLPIEVRPEVPSPAPSIRLSFELLSKIVNDAEECQRLDDDDQPDTVADVKVVRFLDENDELEEEHPLPPPKRRKPSSQAGDLPLRRTRSTSEPRRSNRLRASSENRGS